MIMRWGAVLLVVLGLVAGELEAQTRSAALESLIKAAAAEGELNVMTSTPDNPKAWAKWQELMRAKYGINVTLRQVTGLEAMPLAFRIIEEVKAGRQATTDILMGAETGIPIANGAGALQSVSWREYLPDVPKEALALETAGIAFATMPRGVTYNTKLVPQAEVPRTFEDLLHPRWKGKIASTTQAVGFVHASVALGDERVTKFLTDLSASGNLKGLVRCGDDQRIAIGEFAMLVFACNNRDVELLKRKGAPIEHALFEAMPMFGHLYWGIPKNSAHPNLAKLLAVFMQTPEGQEVMWEYEGFDLHHVKGSRLGREMQSWRARGIEPRLIGPTEIAGLGRGAQERIQKYLKILRGDK